MKYLENCNICGYCKEGGGKVAWTSKFYFSYEYCEKGHWFKAPIEKLFHDPDKGFPTLGNGVLNAHSAMHYGANCKDFLAGELRVITKVGIKKYDKDNIRIDVKTVHGRGFKQKGSRKYSVKQNSKIYRWALKCLTDSTVSFFACK